MNAFVVIFPPRGATRAEFEAAVRQNVTSPEFVDIPSAVSSENIDDAEQLPLWRWFIGS